MKHRKYDKSELQQAVSNSVSLAQVLKQLNIPIAGGNYSTLKTHITRFGIDTNHFKGYSVHKGQIYKPTEQYLSNKVPISTLRLKERLLKEQVLPHKCNNCKGTKWLTAPIPLELHHKDGNSKNNQLSNLELLCPNCHSLTPTYRGRNIGKKIK